MEWKDAMLVKLIIKSTIGGYLRLRVPNAMKVSGTGLLKKLPEISQIFFYQVEETPAAIVSPKANVTAPKLEETLLYDIVTLAGKIYTIVNE